MKRWPTAYRGLSHEQRDAIARVLAEDRKISNRHGDAREFWWLERSPTTIHPPTHLVIRKRGMDGLIIREVVIT